MMIGSNKTNVMNKKLTSLLAEIGVLKEKLSTLRPLPASALEKISEALDIEYK